jgi:hypothetical protein
MLQYSVVEAMGWNAPQGNCGMNKSPFTLFFGFWCPVCRQNVGIGWMKPLRLVGVVQNLTVAKMRDTCSLRNDLSGGVESKPSHYLSG